MKKDQNDAGENGGKLKWHMRINWFWGQIWQLQDTRLQKEEWLMESEFQFILCKKKQKKNEINRKNRKMQLENKQKRLPQGASAIHTYTRT